MSKGPPLLNALSYISFPFVVTLFSLKMKIIQIKGFSSEVYCFLINMFPVRISGKNAESACSSFLQFKEEGVPQSNYNGQVRFY